ncbi:CBS domain-containing protein [Brevundimonas sp. FT23028]|uniref:CBS domain-containing protein n=1 Tax=Brevundimonas sp. FT23028 TaxID=3393748 RepID=UPI003B58AEED
MLVAEILKDKGSVVHTIPPGLSVGEACVELDRLRVGALMVCQDDRVVGVLSERDVVRVVARQGDRGLARPVSEVMTPDVVFAGAGETVGALMARMTDRRIRHLPVLVDERLVGVVSIGDVVKCQIAEARREADSLRTYIAAG